MSTTSLGWLRELQINKLQWPRQQHLQCQKQHCLQRLQLHVQWQWHHCSQCLQPGAKAKGSTTVLGWPRELQIDKLHRPQQQHLQCQKQHCVQRLQLHVQWQWHHCSQRLQPGAKAKGSTTGLGWLRELKINKLQWPQPHHLQWLRPLAGMNYWTQPCSSQASAALPSGFDPPPPGSAALVCAQPSPGPSPALA